ncbi:MAG: SulP family inorganic anion transporter [Burkholderiales bacterium]|nr:SulP family inorganic anion transporter [Burkholderiales bacterium]
MIEIASRLFGPWVRSIDGRTLRADAIAGVLGALLVLPQSFAFATLAGLPPEYGLATAIVPCVIAALFGSSLHVVSGPTNMISLALFATLAPLALVGSPAYIQLALGVTLLVGAMQWLIGALRLGGLANFISPAALRGFTSGAAALIVVHSLPNLLGVAVAEHRVGALLSTLFERLPETSLATLAVAGFAIGATLALRRTWPRLPQMLISLMAATALAAAINRWWPGAGDAGGAIAVLGNVPAAWPHFQWPAFDPGRLPDLLGIAFALTIVTLAQSISIAKAVAERSGQRIDANREFRGQGLSNLVGAFASSYVACGSINRSMPNFEAGARTPLAAVFASVWLLLLVALVAPLLGLIPLAAIAGLLLLIAWSLFDWEGWERLWRFSRRDFAIAAATFAATVTIRLEIAILLGTILSLLSYLYRTSKPSLKVMGFDTEAPGRPFIIRADVAAPLAECPQLKLARMEGEVYFGAVAHVEEQLHDLRAPLAAPKHLLVMAKSMNFIDLAAAEMWRNELHKRRGVGGDLYFHRPRAPVLELWQRVGFLGELGTDHVFPAKHVAIATIFERLDRGICAHCTVRVFAECKTLPPPVAPLLA